MLRMTLNFSLKQWEDGAAIYQTGKTGIALGGFIK